MPVPFTGGVLLGSFKGHGPKPFKQLVDQSFVHQPCSLLLTWAQAMVATSMERYKDGRTQFLPRVGRLSLLGEITPSKVFHITFHQQCQGFNLGPSECQESSTSPSLSLHVGKTRYPTNWKSSASRCLRRAGKLDAKVLNSCVEPKCPSSFGLSHWYSPMTVTQIGRTGIATLVPELNVTATTHGKVAEPFLGTTDRTSWSFSQKNHTAGRKHASHVSFD